MLSNITLIWQTVNVSPKPPNRSVRSALIDAAARLLVEEGPPALTTRRLATEVGASTMAVYTYFRGMEELKRELRREGFARLAAFQQEAAEAPDPLAGVIAQGLAYFINALANSHLYRFMFMEPASEDESDVGLETFETVVHAVRRAVEAGKLDGDAEAMATQLWAASHGAVSLQLSGCLDLQQAIETARDVGINLLVAFGADKTAVTDLVDQAMTRLDAAAPAGMAASDPGESHGLAPTGES